MSVASGGSESVSAAPVARLLRSLVSLSAPLACVNLVSFCIGVVPLVFVSHLDHAPGSVLLAGVGLANSLMKVVGTAAIEGFSSAFDTLGAQRIGHQKAEREERESDDKKKTRPLTDRTTGGAGSHAAINADHMPHPYSPEPVCVSPEPLRTPTGHLPLLSPHPHSVGELFQTFFFYELLLCLAVGAVWLNAKSIFLALGQGRLVSERAQEFLLPLLMGLFPSAVSRLLQGWFSMHQHATPLVVLTCINLVTQILLHFLLINVCGMGFLGAAWAVSTNQLLMCASLLAYACRRGFHRSIWPRPWADPRRLLVQPARSVLRLALPGVVLVSAEWSMFEVCSLLAGSRSTESLTTIVVLINVISTIFMLPTGLAQGVGVLVAHALGERRSLDARRLAGLAIGLILVVGLVPELLMAFAGSTLVSPLVHGRSDVVDLLRPLFPWVALQLLADGIQGVLGGVLRGAAQQQFASVANLVSYYVVGIPIALWLLYSEWSPTDAHTVLALVVGLLAGSTTCALLCSIRIATLGWAEHESAGHLRPEEEEGQTPPPATADADRTHLEADWTYAILADDPAAGDQAEAAPA